MIGPRRLLDRFGRWPFVAAWMLVIFGLSAIPNEFAASSSRIPADKIAHFIEFAIFAALLTSAFARSQAVPSVRAVTIAAAAGILIGMAYGASDEYHQRFVRGRDPGLGDWSADVIGSATGAAGAAALLMRRDERQRAG